MPKLSEKLNSLHAARTAPKGRGPLVSKWKAGTSMTLALDLQLHDRETQYSRFSFKEGEEVEYIGCRTIDGVFYRCFHQSGNLYVKEDEMGYLFDYFRK